MRAVLWFLAGVAATALFFALLLSRQAHSAQVVASIVREARAGSLEDAVAQEVPARDAQRAGEPSADVQRGNPRPPASTEPPHRPLRRRRSR